MPALVKYNTFVDELAAGGHNLKTAVFKCALTNTAPTVATDTVWNTTVAPAPAAANGYPAGASSWCWPTACSRRRQAALGRSATSSSTTPAQPTSWWVTTTMRQSRDAAKCDRHVHG